MIKPKTDRIEINNYINEFSEQEEKSSNDKTKDILINNNNDFLLNKKFKNVSTFSDDSNQKINEKGIYTWKKNKLIIDANLQEQKIIYSLESEQNEDILYAYKDNGFFVIYKLLGNQKKYEKEIISKIKWNMFSNHFFILDNNNNIIEEVTFNFNFRGLIGPTKFQVLIPKENKNFIAKMKLMYKMENKLPEYNSIYKCYVLNFIDRTIIPNEKNIQIVYSDSNSIEDNILLQFAQTGNNEYIVDYKFPFNNITAFALALTNMTSRMFFQ